MASCKGSQNVRHALLPPKIPYPSVSASFTEYLPIGLIGSKAVPKPREKNTRHQRTSSESHLIEEQPSWLDDLLKEPESNVLKPSHRRSSSDSFAYVDAANVSNMSYALQNDYRFRNIFSVPRSHRGTNALNYNKYARDKSFYSETNLLKPKINPWESSGATGTHSYFSPSARENNAGQNSGPSYFSQEAEGVSCSTAETKNPAELVFHDSAKVSLEKKENSNAIPAASETDNTKRCKQQFAQRSRVRKLQYTAELERNVQALQAEGSEVSAELEFLNQQNLILSMENKTLKQRLESLAQEKLIKHLEQEVLEREIRRLRALYQQQQQQEQPQQQKEPQKQSSNDRRASNKDIASQFSNLSLKSKDSNSACDIISSRLRG